jgi:hypothetical protein
MVPPRSLFGTGRRRELHQIYSEKQHLAQNLTRAHSYLNVDSMHALSGQYSPPYSEKG